LLSALYGRRLLREIHSRRNIDRANINAMRKRDRPRPPHTPDEHTVDQRRDDDP
jgi:hypothetical protein